MIDVLLIHSPNSLDEYKISKSVLDNVTCGYGLLQISACLEEKGYNVEIWNLPLSVQIGFSIENWVHILKSYRPYVVGIELNWLHQSKGAIQISKLVKEILPDSFTVLGGTHATLFAHEIIQKYGRVVDAIIKGEAEIPFVELVDDIEKKGHISDSTSGLTRLRENRIISNPVKKIFVDIDKLPHYSHRNVKPSISIRSAVNTCRGPCKYKCIYCIGNRVSYYSGRSEFCQHSPEWIVDQIKFMMSQDGTREFTIQDEAWQHRNKWLKAIAKEIRNEGIHDDFSYFSITALPGSLNQSVLENLSNAGVTAIEYGAESGSNTVLRLSKRPVLAEQILDSVDATFKKGIIPHTWWMVGFPGEDHDALKQTASLLSRTIDLGGVPRWITPIILLPCLEMYEHAKKYGVRPLLHSFEDYEVFSETCRKVTSWYPELITHETNYMNSFEILKAAFALRMLVQRKANKLLKFYLDRIKYFMRGNLNETMLEKDLRSSIMATEQSFF